MQIDRSNYEIWLIDWLDAKLSDLQVEELQLFLEENPDLREEFEELSTFTLRPSFKSFSRKSLLKKTTSDLYTSQFEYLCVAYLEKDLSPEQEAELFETIHGDSEKEKSFELIQKTRLSVPEVLFKHKNKLLKRPRRQKFFRLAAAGLSAAAAIALIIMTYFTVPGNTSDNINNTAKNIVVENNLQKPSADIQSVIISADNKPGLIIKKNEKLFAGMNKKNSVFVKSDSKGKSGIDSLVREPLTPEFLLKKVPVYADLNFKPVTVSDKLIASESALSLPLNDDGRSKLRRFIAKTFREKILKENPSPDSPLKGYEFAEAGVSGLNKLLGWEMALDKNNDNNGELKSIYFSSKILKFKAPVKNTESLP
jgi:hypothetical protein